MQETLFIGLDVHKRSISVAIVDEARGSDIRYLGDIENTPAAITKLTKKLSKTNNKLDFCYEAGCCGYGIYRQIKDIGHDCVVVAPSKIPRASGDRVKTDRKDAQKLAVLHRSGDLTSVWVPDLLNCTLPLRWY